MTSFRTGRRCGDKSTAVVSDGKRNRIVVALAVNLDLGCLAVTDGVHDKLADDAENRVRGGIGELFAWHVEPDCDPCPY
jgi:hypothetical protein